MQQDNFLGILLRVRLEMPTSMESSFT